MILALLMGATTEDPTFARLFGDEVVAAVPEAATEGTAEAPVALAPAPPEIPAWALPGLLLVGAGAAAWWLRRARPAGTAPAMTVLQRQAIGDRSSLVLIEVATGDGERRRLLVGTGGGVPSLVADLGGGFDDVGVPAERPAVPAPAPALPPVGPTAANIAHEVLAERRARGRVVAFVGDDG